jgi:hypothetical protein
MLTPRRTDNNSHKGDRVRGTIIQDLEILDIYLVTFLLGVVDLILVWLRLVGVVISYS